MLLFLIPLLVTAWREEMAVPRPSSSASSSSSPSSSPLCLPRTDASVYRMPPAEMNRDIAFQQSPFVKVGPQPWRSNAVEAPSILLEAPMGVIALFAHAPMSLGATRSMLHDPFSALTDPASVATTSPASYFPSSFPPSSDEKEVKRNIINNSSSMHPPPPHIIRPGHRKAVRLALLAVGGLRQGSLRGFRSIRENVLSVHNSIVVRVGHNLGSGLGDGGSVPSPSSYSSSSSRGGGEEESRLTGTIGEYSRAFGPLSCGFVFCRSIEFKTALRSNVEIGAEAAFAFEEALLRKRNDMRRLKNVNAHVSGPKRFNRFPYHCSIELASHLLRIVLGDEVERFSFHQTQVQQQQQQQQDTQQQRAAQSSRPPLLRLYHLRRLFRLSLSRLPWNSADQKAQNDSVVYDAETSRRYFRIMNPIWDYVGNGDGAGGEGRGRGRRRSSRVRREAEGIAASMPALPTRPRAVILGRDEGRTRDTLLGERRGLDLLSFLSSPHVG